jgi:hypothetical protein
MTRSRTLTAIESAAACVLSAALLIALMAREWPQLVPGDASRDFSMLYVAAERALADQPLYAQTDPALPGPLLNFNPPHFHAVLVPLTLFPLRTAYVVWNLTSLALLFLLLFLTFREGRLRLGAPERWLVVAGILGSVGVAATLRMGQVSMWVALLVTLAWRAARRGSPTSAGVWLGLAISVKPFLLLGIPALLVRGRVRAASMAGLVAVAGLASGGLWLGWSTLGDWFEVLQSPRRATSFPLNASTAGIVARAGMPESVWLIAAAAIAALTLCRVRHSDEDSAWGLWIAAALLCSPLGWVYYLPLLIGPVYLLAITGRLARWTWWLAPAFLPPPLSPVLLQSPPIAAATFGSAYCWGLSGLWLAMWTGADRRARSAGVPSSRDDVAQERGSYSNVSTSKTFE